MSKMTKTPQIRPNRGRTVALLAYDGVQTLDVVGPADVFAAANRRRSPEDPGYRVVLVSPAGGTVRANSGLAFAETLALAELRAPVDTLVIAGGDRAGRDAVAADGRTLRWLRRRARSIRRMCSVCTGAFLLAEASLLARRRVVTHWGSCAELARRFPEAVVEPDALFVADPPIFTSAGVTAAIDLCLVLVEADLGRRVALAVARDLVLFVRRPGGQAQYSAALSAQSGASDRLRDLIQWIHEHPESDLHVARIAHRVGMSVRNFARVFRRETGLSPARFVETARIERAKLYLEDTDWSLARVAQRAGFGSEDSLLRAFRRCLGVPPRDYRARFSSGGDARGH